jgi:hypothetical protein
MVISTNLDAISAKAQWNGHAVVHPNFRIGQLDKPFARELRLNR